MFYGQTVVPKTLDPVTSVNAGWQHTCVIKVNGHVRCWGRNVSGVLTVPPSLR
jgi:alpha-tubulin suppressor-like RCC1 family protein